jgi:serine protease Do/serine protease DegQ
MKTPLRFGLLALIVSVFAPLVGFAAKAAKPPPRAKPEVRLDPSPVADGKSPAVVSYADIVEPVQKAVVSIYSTKIVRERVIINPFFRQLDQERESKQEGLGSGVIVSADGYILTNHHVVEGADELKVSLSDDREFVGKVIGTDPKTDIAVVKIEGENLPLVPFADSGKLRVGDVVFAVGNPLGVGQTVTMGIVSAKGRHVGLLDDKSGYEDYIQTDAAINMGNSGGALVDAKGRLIGINSGILSPTRVNIGIGFAVPINLAASVMNSLVTTGAVARGFLGVRPDPSPVTPEIAEQLDLPKDTKGVVVADIEPGSAAEKAGLRRTDVIVAINGKAVAAFEELHFESGQMQPGAVAKLKVFRDGKAMLVEATLGRTDVASDEFLAGVEVEPMDSAARRRLRLNDRRITGGLLITSVGEKSPYRDVLAPDMVILEINRTPVAELATAKPLLKPGGNLLAVYYRGAVFLRTINVRRN